MAAGPEQRRARPIMKRPGGGAWHEEAKAWWRAASSSDAAAWLWHEAEWQTARRCLVLVEKWWRIVEDPEQAAPSSALGDSILRHEGQLYLTTFDRLRAVKDGQIPTGPPSEQPAKRPAGSRARDRLRAVDSA